MQHDAVVHAYEDQDDAHGGVPETLAQALRDHVDDVIGRAGEGGGHRIETFVRRGAPWEKILNFDRVTGEERRTS